MHRGRADLRRRARQNHIRSGQVRRRTGSADALGRRAGNRDQPLGSRLRSRRRRLQGGGSVRVGRDADTRPGRRRPVPRVGRRRAMRRGGIRAVHAARRQPAHRGCRRVRAQRGATGPTDAHRQHRVPLRDPGNERARWDRLPAGLLGVVPFRNPGHVAHDHPRFLASRLLRRPRSLPARHRRTDRGHSSPATALDSVVHRSKGQLQVTVSGGGLITSSDGRDPLRLVSESGDGLQRGLRLLEATQTRRLRGDRQGRAASSAGAGSAHGRSPGAR